MPLHYSLPVVLGFSLQNLMNARQVFYPRATHNLPHAVNLMSQHKQKVPINREVRQHMWYLISASRGWEGSNHTACSLCLGGAFKQHPTSLYSSHVTVTSFKDLASKQPDILFKLAFLPKRYTEHLCASHRAGSASQQYGSQKRVLPTHCSGQPLVSIAQSKGQSGVQNRGLGTQPAGPPKDQCVHITVSWSQGRVQVWE